MPEQDLNGRVAIVTGGSLGIGLAISLDLAARGADIVIAARNQGRMDAAVVRVHAMGRRAIGVATEVTKSGQVTNLVERTLAEFGRVDILVNNAGGSNGANYKRGPLLETEETDFDESIAANLKSVWLCAKAVTPTMLRQGRGAIINISSVAADPSRGTRVGFGVYSAAKVGVINLTHCMAAEWGPEIRVNCVVPGWIETERVMGANTPASAASMLSTIAQGRIGQPADIAKAVTYLASDDAGYVSGAVLFVDGGYKSGLPALLPQRPAP